VLDLERRQDPAEGRERILQIIHHLAVRYFDQAVPKEPLFERTTRSEFVVGKTGSNRVIVEMERQLLFAGFRPSICCVFVKGKTLWQSN
jgi:hypothetical protein